MKVMIKNTKKHQFGDLMSNFTKFFLGFFFIVFMFDLMLIDRKKTMNNMINLFATFNKIDGLNIGDNVMISGISVGFVNDIVLDNNYPKISMMVNENLKITRDSSVSIQTDGLFGSKFLVIEIGGEEEYLKSNDSFSYVEDSILLQDLLDNIIKIGENNKL
ncbi:MAG: MCE family protein [Pelagibacteraceae bacterium TMED124]|nr:hypothetical protein [Rickettsiales bacterium]RPG16658.1 MAG: MCE family protein [Pelagibacteraceae bacterium TMED124]